jgi:hypothetical protein
MAVEAINRDAGIVLMCDGCTWPVSVWLDDDGEECESQDAIFAVVGPCKDEYRKEFWVTLELSDFQSVAVQ